jgi:ceramide glucosyltransferase
MDALLPLHQILLGFCILIGSVCWLGVLVCALGFRARTLHGPSALPISPGVTVLKPVCGLEKNLGVNLRSACLQDYPDYQVVYSVQRADDPALPLLREIQLEFGSERVALAVSSASIGANGKVDNLAGALPHARHELLVISDSDVLLRRDYLRRIIAPLADPQVGIVSTFFRGRDAGPWYEQMEQLTLNADHMALAILASATGLADFCFGASTALSKTTLAAIGGFESLADFLTEDTEMGRRVLGLGKRLVDVPYVVDTTVDLASAGVWWQKQTYWDQNTRVAVPRLFLASLFLRVIPLALLFAALRGWDALGLWLVGIAFASRMAAAVAVVGVALADVRGLLSVWLIPLKDVLSLIWFVRAFAARRVVWRGVEMSLTRDGRLSAVVSAARITAR